MSVPRCLRKPILTFPTRTFPPRLRTRCATRCRVRAHYATTPRLVRADRPPVVIYLAPFFPSFRCPSQVVDALCRMVPRDQAATAGRALLAKMTRLLDRQQFEVVLQVGCVG